MTWSDSYTDPRGATSRVHFTRAWTLLFFVRLVWWLAFSMLALVFASAGAGDPGAYLPPGWAFLVLLVVTAVASVVLHVRRLTDAQRNPLWAVLVFLPILIGGVGFVQGLGMASGEYSAAAEAKTLEQEGMSPKLIAVELDRDGAARLLAREILVRAELAALEDQGQSTPPFLTLFEDADVSSPLISQTLLDLSMTPDASQTTAIAEGLAAVIAERQGEDGENAQQRGEADARRGGEGRPPSREGELRGELGGIQRQWRGMLPDIPVTQLSARSYALDAATGAAVSFWAIPSLLVMIWSLVWVGRLPTGGGTIRSRFTD